MILRLVLALLVFLGAVFAPLALGQLAPSLPKDDPAKAGTAC
jgi:hypothetical protein